MPPHDTAGFGLSFGSGDGGAAGAGSGSGGDGGGDGGAGRGRSTSIRWNNRSNLFSSSRAEAWADRVRAALASCSSRFFLAALLSR